MTKWFTLFAFMLSCFIPLTGIAEEIVTTMPWAQLEREAKEGNLLPLEPLGDDVDAIVDGIVYGYGVKRFMTFFEVGDASIFAAVGLTPPQGTITWTEFMGMADAVEKYNQQNTATIGLLATQAQRFPSTFSLMEQSDIQEQWDAIQSIVYVYSEGKNENNVLLTERSVSIESIGNNIYVTGLQSDDTVYPLAEPETRYAVIRRDMDISAAARSEWMSSVKEATPVETGIIPPDMSYEQFLGNWNLSIPAPSETNFYLWKQAEGNFNP